jgi:hypothetical protein
VCLWSDGGGPECLVHQESRMRIRVEKRTSDRWLPDPEVQLASKPHKLVATNEGAREPRKILREGMLTMVGTHRLLQ